MILINLLPPELRKRHGGISPAFASIVGGGIANLLLLGFWVFLNFIRVPHAGKELVARQDDLRAKTIEAQKVLDMKAKIQEHEERRDKILMLINSKMYWARTLDDFANRLSGTWSVPGFEVHIGELTIKEAAAPQVERGGRKNDIQVNFGFRWRYKMVGAQFDKSGEYMKSFFKTTEKDPFWRNHGFAGKPEDSYRGDQPKWNDDIHRVVVENTLEWQRAKTVTAVKPAPVAPAAPVAATPTTAPVPAAPAKAAH